MPPADEFEPGPTNPLLAAYATDALTARAPVEDADERTDPGQAEARAWDAEPTDDHDQEITGAGDAGPRIIPDDGAYPAWGEVEGEPELIPDDAVDELVLGVPVVPVGSIVASPEPSAPDAIVSPVILAAARDGSSDAGAPARRDRKAMSPGRASEPGLSSSPGAGAALKGGLDPWVGRSIAERYRIERPIAAGGMGRVYLATQVPLGRLVAIKVVRSEMAGSRQHFLKRFFLEASACAKLTHPNIITLHDYGEADGDVFMAMEFLDGRSLDKEIKDTAPMAPERALHIAIQVSRALREAHAKQIIHRDLKPQNIMLVEQGDETDFVKVLDFGLVKIMTADEPEQELTRAGTLLGSPNYMSPEQILGGTLDHRSDIYSLGVVLFKMLTARNPYARDADTDVIYKHVYHPIPTLASAGVAVPDAIEALVARCLAKKAEDRFADCKELVLALKEARREVVGPGARKRRKAEAAAPDTARSLEAIRAPEPSRAVEPARAPEPAPVVVAPPRPVVSEPPRPAVAEPSPEPIGLSSTAPADSGRRKPARAFNLEKVGSGAAYHLRGRDGARLGPITREELEILYYARIIDDETPLASNAGDFTPLGAHGALRTTLSSFRDQVTAGAKPWERVQDARPLTSPLQALARCALGKATGTLRAERPDGELLLSYQDGKVTELGATVPALSLGRYLIEKKLVTQKAFEDNLPLPPARSGDLCDALIAQGLVPPHVLMEKLAEWARYVMGWLLSWDPGDLSFEAGNPAPAQIPLAFDRWGLLTEVVRAHLGRDTVERALSSAEARVVMPATAEGVGLDDLKLQPKELRLLRGLDGTKTVGELQAVAGGNKEQRETFQRLLYLGLELGLVVLGEDTQAPKDRAEAQRLLGILDKLKGKTPFEVLNASEAANDEDLRAKYMDLAKQYHPDNARPGAAPELADALRALFTFVQETHAMVETQEKRDKYRSIRSLGYTGRESEEEVVRRVLEAEISFKKAKTFVKLSKYEEALAEMRDAVAKKPKDVELRIHLRYFEFLSRKQNKAVEAEACLAELTPLMKGENADLISGLLILGKLHKALQREDQALKMFRKVLKIDEKNHEAESEVRLMMLREERKSREKKTLLGAIGGAIAGKDKS